MSGTATFLKERNGRGIGAVYRLDPPTKNFDGEAIDVVWVSAITSAGRYSRTPETFAFPCTPDGTVLSWSELPMSQNGVYSIGAILQDAGYKPDKVV